MAGKFRPFYLNAAIGFLAATVAYVPFFRSDLFPNIIGCQASRHGDETYLAYCLDGKYRDYEHAAYHLGLEPEAVEGMRNADVLFLGNSRTQFAFSTASLLEAFERRRLQPHVLGFGYAEGDRFAEILLTKYPPKAELIVVNVDPFFSGKLSIAATEAVRDGPLNLLYFSIKRWQQLAHRRLCADGSRAWLCDRVPAIYRTKDTGFWLTANWPKPESKPIRIPETPPAPPADFHVMEADARHFLSLPTLRKTCVVFTTVPSPYADPELGRRLAQAVGVPFVFVQDGTETTFDENHLDDKSAHEWSRRFLDRIWPVLETCRHTQ